MWCYINVRKVLKNGKKKYIPVKTYCYKSITTSIEQLLHRDGMLEACKQYRERDVPEAVMCDITDGNVFKEFGKCEGPKGFFEVSDTNLGFMLNINWLQPYKRRSDKS